MNDPVIVSVSLIFLRDLKRLRKAYRRVDTEVERLIGELENGEERGIRLTNVDPYIIYKVRLANPDARRGKSGGFRVLYYLRTQTHIILVTIYSKSEREDIPPEVLWQMIDEIEAAFKTPPTPPAPQSEESPLSEDTP
jgi:mRNA-degrading endonuclease RelE of RelBE toxin-antitoxin system